MISVDPDTHLVILFVCDKQQEMSFTLAQSLTRDMFYCRLQSMLISVCVCVSVSVSVSVLCVCVRLCVCVCVCVSSVCVCVCVCVCASVNTYIHGCLNAGFLLPEIFIVVAHYNLVLTAELNTSHTTNFAGSCYSELLSSEHALSCFA